MFFFSLYGVQVYTPIKHRDLKEATRVMETTSTEQVVRNEIKLFTFFYETEMGVIARGDIGDISSVFTSGRYDQTAKATYLGRQLKRGSRYF